MWPDFHGGHGDDDDHEHEEEEEVEVFVQEPPVALDEEPQPNRNPGSDYSVANGCVCDPVVNNSGLIPPDSVYNGYGRNWIIVAGCPQHV